MKVSLLIPVYNFDIVALVYSLKSGLGKVAEFVEIIIGDDGSNPEFREKYLSLVGDNVRLVSSEKNIGRAAIKNRLALEAAGDYLLFIDADAVLPSTAEAYFHKWLPFINEYNVICGGTLYHDAAPGDPDKLLRWKYGKFREQRPALERNKNPLAYFSTFNVMIARSVFSKIRFNEELKQYGYEDTLMGYQLKKAGIKISHIDNGLFHEGLETNKEFLSKTKLAIENLSKLYDSVTDRRAFSRTVRVLKIYRWLKFFRLAGLVALIYIKFRDRIEILLESRNTSPQLFLLFKLGLFCTYREIHRRKKIQANA